MPKSKKRTISKQKRRRRVVNPLHAPKTPIWKTQLNGSRLQFLKKDPDFLAMIKMGRVVNTTLFAIQCMIEHMAESTPMETRQSRRAFFVLGGYLHEGLALSKSLQGRYLGLPEYEQLRRLVHDRKHHKAREYIKAVRNFAAFHLDQYDTTTRQTLTEMQLAWYDLMSGDAENKLNIYFEFSDIVDMEFLVRKFENGQTRQEAAKDIHTTVMNFAEEFTLASNSFLQFLIKRSKIAEHIKRGFVAAPKPDPRKPDPM
jgi:hypothetical protein